MPTPRAALLALLTTVLLTACGDQAGPGGPVTAGRPSTDPGPTAAAPEPEPLTPRTTPLAVGDHAPSFKGLPPGKAVVVFYRGHW